MTTLRVPSAPKITLWHHPGCSQSRRALELLQLTDCQVDTFDYQATPPTIEQLQGLLHWLGRRPVQLVRTKDPVWTQLGLSGDDDEAVLAALCRNPILIQRPIAVAEELEKAVVGRPPELVLQLLIPELPSEMNAQALLRQALGGKLPS